MSFDDLLKHQASFSTRSTSSSGGGGFGAGGFGGFGDDLDTSNPFADLGGGDGGAGAAASGFSGTGLSSGASAFGSTAGYGPDEYLGAGREGDGVPPDQELGTVERHRGEEDSGWDGGELDTGVDAYRPAAPSSPSNTFVIPGPSNESDPNQAIPYREEEGGFGAPMRLPSPPPGAGVDFSGRAAARGRRTSSVGSRGSSEAGFGRPPSTRTAEDARHSQGFYTHRQVSPPTSSTSAGFRTYDAPPSPSTARTASSRAGPTQASPPPAAEEAAFRPFGVTATLSSAAPDDEDDLLAQSQTSPSSSRAALPDILLGQPDSGAGGGGIRGLAASTALPAFKASPKKVRQAKRTSVPPVAAQTTKEAPGGPQADKKEGAEAEEGKKQSEEKPATAHSRSSSSATKPYRPFGLKRAEPKPVVPKEPPPPPAPPKPVSPPPVSAPAPPAEPVTRAISPPVAPAAAVEAPSTASEEAAPPASSAAEVQPAATETQSPTATETRSTAPEDAPAAPVDDVSPPKEATVAPASPSRSLPRLPSRPSSVSVNTTSSTTAIMTSVPQSPRSATESITALHSASTPTPTDEPRPSLIPPPAAKAAESDEDERPLAAVRKGLIEAAAAASANGLPPSGIETPPVKAEPRYTCAVGDPQKMGAIGDIHTVYTVRTKSTDPSAQGPLKPQSTVLRRFRDFVWLFEALATNNPGVIIPPIPDKNIRSRFQTDFIAARRIALEIFLHKTANHPMLASDPDLKLFLESDTFTLEIKHRKPDPTSQQQGWLSNLGGPRFIEFDDFYDQRRASLDALEHQLRALHLSLATAAKSRLTLAAQLSELGATIGALSTCDLSKPMRLSLDRLAALQKRVQVWSEEQAKDEEEGIAATIDAYARVCGSVKATFGGRVKAWEKWKLAEQNLRKVQAAWEKIKRQGGGPGVANVSLAELSDAERRAHDAQNEFEDVSKLIKAEMQRFDKEKVDDFKDAIGRYVDGLLSRQRLIVAAWQEYYQVLQGVAKQNMASGEPAGSVETANGAATSQEGVNGSAPVTAS